MKLYTIAALIGCWSVTQVHAKTPSRVQRFTVEGQSRLAALALVGRMTNSSLLIEGGDIDFLKAPISLSENDRSSKELIALLLRGEERYTVTQKGRLTIAYPLAPRRPINRILTLQLVHFHFKGGSVSGLDPYLDFKIKEATGCRPQGFGYSGPPMNAGIHAFDLSAGTFEDVVVHAANAAVPTMWVVLPDSRQYGCISDPGSMWEVGMYGEEKLRWPFRESIGPDLVQ